MKAVRNGWCERLGVDPPRGEDLVGQPEIRVSHLVVAALLETGVALSLDVLVERLDRAGFVAASGDTRVSIVKGWHGGGGILRESDGRFALDVMSHDLALMLFSPMKLVGPRESAEPPPPPAVVPELPGADVPLAREEIAVLFEWGLPANFATLRVLTGVLDAIGEPVDRERLAQILEGLGKNPRSARYDAAYRVKNGMPIRVREDGRLELVADHPEVRRTREILRELERKAVVAVAAEARSRDVWEQYRRRAASRRRDEQSAAALQKRRVVQLLVEDGRVLAAACVDVEAHRVSSHVGAKELETLVADLRRADIVAGLGIREGLRSLGLDPDSITRVDLMPPQKTLRENGRVLRLTPELVARSTTRNARALGGRADLLGHFAAGATTKLRRRLEADAKSLHAMWRYGALHHHVRVTSGLLDVMIPASWMLPGDVSALEMLEEALEAGTVLDLVCGEATPAWDDPWAHARPGRIEQVGFNDVFVRWLDNSSVEILPRWLIQAARPHESIRH